MYSNNTSAANGSLRNVILSLKLAAHGHSIHTSLFPGFDDDVVVDNLL